MLGLETSIKVILPNIPIHLIHLDIFKYVGKLLGYFQKQI